MNTPFEQSLRTDLLGILRSAFKLDHDLLWDTNDLTEKRASLQQINPAPQGQSFPDMQRDYAIVVWDGYSYEGFLPVDCASSISISRSTLDAAVGVLPDEAVKVAHSFIEQRARELGIESAEAANVDDLLPTNVLYTGDVAVRPYAEKLAAAYRGRRAQEKTAGDEGTWLFDGQRISIKTADEVRHAARLIQSGALPLQGRDKAVAARRLSKRANEVGVALDGDLARFGRDTVPAAAYELTALRKQAAPESLHELYDELLEGIGEMAPMDAAMCIDNLDMFSGRTPAEDERGYTKAASGLTAWDVVFPKTEETVTLVPQEVLDKVAHAFGEEARVAVERGPQSIEDYARDLSYSERALFKDIIRW